MQDNMKKAGRENVKQKKTKTHRHPDILTQVYPFGREVSQVVDHCVDWPVNEHERGNGSICTMEERGQGMKEKEVERERKGRGRKKGGRGQGGSERGREGREDKEAVINVGIPPAHR